jgi:hypothetical protein
MIESAIQIRQIRRNFEMCHGPLSIGLSDCLSTLPRTCTHPPSLAVSCAGPSTRVCTDMVVLRGIHSGCRPFHPLVLDVGVFGMHEVHSVRHSGGEPLSAGDTMFRVCVPSPSQTECSHSRSCSRSHPCAGVHGWHVADVCLCWLSCAGSLCRACIGLCASRADSRGDVLHADGRGWVVHRSRTAWARVVFGWREVHRKVRGGQCSHHPLDPDIDGLGVPGTE